MAHNEKMERATTLAELMGDTMERQGRSQEEIEAKQKSLMNFASTGGDLKAAGYTGAKLTGWAQAYMDKAKGNVSDMSPNYPLPKNIADEASKNSTIQNSSVNMDINQLMGTISPAEQYGVPDFEQHGPIDNKILAQRLTSLMAGAVNLNLEDDSIDTDAIVSAYCEFYETVKNTCTKQSEEEFMKNAGIEDKNAYLKAYAESEMKFGRDANDITTDIREATAKKAFENLSSALDNAGVNMLLHGDLAESANTHVSKNGDSVLMGFTISESESLSMMHTLMGDLQHDNLQASIESLETRAMRDKIQSRLPFSDISGRTVPNDVKRMSKTMDDPEEIAQEYEEALAGYGL